MRWCTVRYSDGEEVVKPVVFMHSGMLVTPEECFRSIDGDWRDYTDNDCTATVHAPAWVQFMLYVPSWVVCFLVIALLWVFIAIAVPVLWVGRHLDAIGKGTLWLAMVIGAFGSDKAVMLVAMVGLILIYVMELRDIVKDVHQLAKGKEGSYRSRKGEP